MVSLLLAEQCTQTSDKTAVREQQQSNAILYLVYLVLLYSNHTRVEVGTNSMRVDEGRTGGSLVAIKVEARITPSAGGGGRACLATPDLSYV